MNVICVFTLICSIVSAFFMVLDIKADSNKDSETYISENAYDCCEEIGGEYNICPEILMAIIEKESGGMQYATNGNCKGLMQVSERWHAQRMLKLGVSDLYCEKDNILVAADYLSELYSKYNDTALVLDIYNGNSSAMSNYENGILSPYAQSILTRAAYLERLHNK